MDGAVSISYLTSVSIGSLSEKAQGRGRGALSVHIRTVHLISEFEWPAVLASCVGHLDVTADRSQ